MKIVDVEVLPFEAGGRIGAVEKRARLKCARPVSELEPWPHRISRVVFAKPV